MSFSPIVRNLKRATRFFVRRRRPPRPATLGQKPGVYPSGRRQRRWRTTPTGLDFLFWTWPGWLLFVTGLFAHERSHVRALFGWALMSMCALALGIAAPLSRPREAAGYLYFAFNLATIVFVYFALGIGG